MILNKVLSVLNRYKLNSFDQELYLVTYVKLHISEKCLVKCC